MKISVENIKALISKLGYKPEDGTDGVYFKKYSHQIKLTNPINSTNEIYETSIKILNEMWRDIPVRLIGIRLDNLTSSFNYQASIFDDFNKKSKNEKLDKTIDNLKTKYGNNILKKAKLLSHDK